MMIGACDLQKAFPPRLVPEQPLVSRPHLSFFGAREVSLKLKMGLVPPPFRTCHSSQWPGLLVAALGPVAWPALGLQPSLLHSWASRVPAAAPCPVCSTPSAASIPLILQT